VIAASQPSWIGPFTGLSPRCFRKVVTALRREGAVRRDPGQTELPVWKEEHNRSHRKVRARVEHTFARMKGWKILRDCRLKGDGVHHAVPGIARLHNLALAG
jgi:hypothetical protein